MVLQTDDLLSEPLRGRPGPERNSSEYGLPSTHAQSAGVIPNSVPRTSEPDNDDCAQPDQRYNYRHEDSARDNCTIISHRTGTSTLDTEKTVQRGSRSKKPSPDRDVQPQPLVRRARPPVGATDNSPHDSHTSHTMPSSLSFPSPPSVDDDELPTHHQTPFACSSVSVVPEIAESLSSCSSRSGFQPQDSFKIKERSRKRYCIVGIVGLMVLIIIVIAVCMKTTKDAGKESDQNLHNNDQPVSDDADSVPSSAPTSTILWEPELDSQPPSPAPTAKNVIVVLTGNTTDLNLTAGHGGNETMTDDLDDESDALVPAEEDEETASPSKNQSAATKPQTLTPSLRRAF